MKTNKLTQTEKDLIINWAEGELLMEEESFVNRDHYIGYLQEVKTIINKLK